MIASDSPVSNPVVEVRSLTRRFGAQKELMDILSAVYPERRLRLVVVKKSAFGVHGEISAVGGIRDSGSLLGVWISEVSQSDVIGYSEGSSGSLTRDICQAYSR